MEGSSELMRTRGPNPHEMVEDDGIDARSLRVICPYVHTPWGQLSVGVTGNIDNKGLMLSMAPEERKRACVFPQCCL